ncbi:AGE family epimerase/isomerase [Paracoccaceae bacterium Fryx2]|nr:AGE family epimerase/isomerase [Paracoccaceae bacterium Fryx2]
MTAARDHGSASGAEGWAVWFWTDFLPDWLAQVQDAEGGVFDALDHAGRPAATADKTLLTQSRTLFILSHLALLSGDPTLTAAAQRQAAFLPRFRKAPGLYCRAVHRDGSPTGLVADDVSRSYDHSFVLLALATWGRLAPSADTQAEIEACWATLCTTLTDPATGLLLEDDGIADPAGPGAPPRAQNPHMHLYEACLQAHEMSGEARWLERAAGLRALALRHFLDAETGSIAEFLAPDLRPLPGTAGLRREPGHQCEWAWLLWREADLGGDPALRSVAARLARFADTHGFAPAGPLQGAAYDAVAASGGVMEESFLLWPQTEAIKAFAVRHTAGDATAGGRARALLCLMFESWFAGRPAFVNRLDKNGVSLWSEALTRLLYHLALALTEGARAGLWPGIPRPQKTQ